MKLRRFLKLTTVLTVCALLITMLLPISSQAAEAQTPDLEKKCTLNIYFEPGVSNFHLYRVGSMDKDGHFTMEQQFATFFPGEEKTKLDGLDDTKKMVEFAGELQTILHSGAKVTRLADTKTKENGYGSFDDLSAGMYLLVKPKMEVNGIKYAETAQIVTLPYYMQEEKQWVYDPLAEIKVIEEKMDNDIEVEKQWDFKAAKKLSKKKKAKLKKEIEVELRVDRGDGSGEWDVYQDGSDTDYGHIKLNAKNGWKKVFKNVNLGEGAWRFYEVTKLDDFETEVAEPNGNVQIITNVYVPTDTPPGDNPPGDNPPGDGTTRTGNGKLPQTGQLWWPVPVLAAIGLAFFVIGAFKNKYYHKKNDKK